MVGKALQMDIRIFITLFIVWLAFPINASVVAKINETIKATNDLKRVYTKAR